MVPSIHQDIKENFVKLKVRFDRGYSWIKYFRDFFIITASLKILNLDFSVLIPIIICLYLFGYLDEKKGIWKLEEKYYPENINPFFIRLEKKLDELRRIKANHNIKKMR